VSGSLARSIFENGPFVFVVSLFGTFVPVGLDKYEWYLPVPQAQAWGG
jgi:hypothetical protein